MGHAKQIPRRASQGCPDNGGREKADDQVLASAETAAPLPAAAAAAALVVSVQGFGREKASGLDDEPPVHCR